MPKANAWSGTESTTKTTTSDVNGIDWMAQQNGGQFDPLLFGDYRESQDAVLNNDFGGFFDEAFPLPDLGNFGSPLSLANVASPAPRRDLMQEIENRQDEEPEDVRAERPKQLSCNKIWLVLVSYLCRADKTNQSSLRDQLQNSPLFQNGELDVDSLCAELKTKAKCSETGLVLEPNEVDDVLRRFKAR